MKRGREERSRRRRRRGRALFPTHTHESDARRVSEYMREYVEPLREKSRERKPTFWSRERCGWRKEGRKVGLRGGEGSVPGFG